MPRKVNKEAPGKNHRPAGQPNPGSAWFAVMVLVAAVLVSYAGSLHCPFVFDDHNDIVDNATIRRLWPLEEVFLARGDHATRLQTRPVVNLSFALDYALGGLDTLPYHLTNLAIHVLAGLALFGTVRRTLLLPRYRDRFGRRAVPLALAVALLWAVHPLQTESVTYITQRYESLMGLFYLLAIYGLVRCADSPYPRRWCAVTVSAALLSLGSKEVAVSLPIVILLYDRLLLAGSLAEVWRRRWGMYLALLAAWALFALVQITAVQRPWAGYGLPASWLAYARSEPGVVLHYLRLALWPRPLVLDYGWRPALTAGEILPGAVAVAMLLAATGYALWRWPAGGLLGAWFFLILAPTSSVMPLADLAFEHRMYLPLASVAVAVVFGVHAFVRRLPLSARGRATVLTGLLSGAVFALAVLTWQRNNDYRDDLTLWQHVVARRPDNPRAYNSLGNALADRGRGEEAIAQFSRALELAPDYAVAHYNLGNSLAGRGKGGDIAAAALHYRAALKINPNYAAAYNNLAEILVARGELAAAIVHYRRALQVRPDYAEAHNNLGNALAGRGEAAAAIEHYRRALEIQPDFAAAHNNLGFALVNCGQFDEAVAEYRQALRIRPDYAEAHFNLGFVLAGRGQFAEAIEHYRQAVRDRPGFAAAHFNLGYALAGSGDFGAAIEHYQKALDLEPESADAHTNLGYALARLQQYEAAIVHYRKALKIKPDQAEAHYNLGLALAASGNRGESLAEYQKALVLAAEKHDTALAEMIRAQIRR